MSRPLSPDALARAESFLADHARPLEHATWTWVKDPSAAKAEAIRAALSTFRHPDGGFGHALEPDIQASGASVYATTVALQTLRDIGAPADDPLVTGAMAYLAASYDADQRAWPMVPADLESAPHAPWWEGEEDLKERRINPRAEIVADFLRWPGALPQETTLSLLGDILPDLAKRSESLEQHELLCALRLLRAPLARADRTRLESVLRPVVERLVGRDAAAWSEYGLQPLWITEAPDAPYADDLSDAIEANLDWLIETQGADGAWSPAWDWSFVDAAAWAKAKVAWQGVLTVKTLRALQAHGRLAGER